MENKIFVKELDRIIETKKGEVILLNQPNPNILNYFMLGLVYNHAPLPEIPFHAMLGIYNGINREGSFVRDCGMEICNELYRNRNFELTLAHQGKINIPLIHIPIHEDCMVLEDRAFIGPEEISKVLKKEGKGYFTKFFKEYVKAYRKIE